MCVRADTVQRGLVLSVVVQSATAGSVLYIGYTYSTYAKRYITSVNTNWNISILR